MHERPAATIRPATTDDLAVLCQLYAEFSAFNLLGLPGRLAEPGQPGGFDVRRQEANLRRLLGASGGNLIVAEAEGGVAGLAEIYLRQTARGAPVAQQTYGHLQSLIVRGELRGRGLGRLLLAAAEAWARARGATELQLECWEFAGGPLGFYEGAGYRSLSRTLARDIGAA